MYAYSFKQIMEELADNLPESEFAYRRGLCDAFEILESFVASDDVMSPNVPVVKVISEFLQVAQELCARPDHSPFLVEIIANTVADRVTELHNDEASRLTSLERLVRGDDGSLWLVTDEE